MCDCMALCAVLQVSIWHYIDGHKSIMRFAIDDRGVISVTEMPMLSSLDISKKDLFMNLTVGATHYCCRLFVGPVSPMTGNFLENANDILTAYVQPPLPPSAPIMLASGVTATVYSSNQMTINFPRGMYADMLC